MDVQTKRNGGEITVKGDWRVIVECKGEGDDIHSCGHPLCWARVKFSHGYRSSIVRRPSNTAVRENIPWCSNCEREPVAGIFYENPYEIQVTEWKDD